jgi:hypothetical protein
LSEPQDQFGFTEEKVLSPLPGANSNSAVTDVVVYKLHQEKYCCSRKMGFYTKIWMQNKSV